MRLHSRKSTLTQVRLLVDNFTDECEWCGRYSRLVANSIRQSVDGKLERTCPRNHDEFA